VGIDLFILGFACISLIVTVSTDVEPSKKDQVISIEENHTE